MIDQPSKAVFSLRFIYLEDFAKFLLQEKIHEFVSASIEYSKELNLPIMKLFEAMPYEKMYELSVQSNKDLLQAVIHGNAHAFIMERYHAWVNNQVPLLDTNEIVSDDIILGFFIRRNTFLKFIPLYTDDVAIAIGLAYEIDKFATESETMAMRFIVNLQQQQLSDQLLKLKHTEALYKEAEALTHIGNWEWHVGEDAITWSDEMYRIYGLEPQSEQIDFAKFTSFLYPDDREYAMEHIQTSLSQGIGNTFYHRILLANGEVKTLHAIGNVIKDDTGKVIRMYGTGQDVTMQKNTEAQLNEKQNFLTKIATVTPSLISAYNVHTGKFIFINNSLKSSLGYDTDIAMNEGVSFFINITHPDDLTALLAKNTSVMQESNVNFKSGDDEPVVEFIYRMRHKNGEYRWFQTYGTVFDRDAENAIQHVINISIDITDQYILKAKWEEEKNFAELLIESSPYMILTYDKNCTVLAWNKKSEDATGIKKENIIGKNIYDVFPEYSKSDWESQFQKVLAGETIYTPKIPLKRSGGWGESFVIPLKSTVGDTFGVLSITHDITAQILAAEQLAKTNTELALKIEELHESEERYQRMTEEVQDYAIILLNKEGIIQHWNRGAEKIKGYKAGEIIGRHFRIFYSEEDRINKLPEKIMADAVEHSRAIYEGYRIKKDGSPFWGLTVITALHNESGNIIGFSKVTRDLTEKKIAEERMANYAETLEKQNIELNKSNAALQFARKQLAEERTKSLVEIMPHIVVLANVTGKIQYINHHLLDFTGLDPKAIKTGNWLTIIHKDDIQRVRQALKTAIENGNSLHEDLRLKRADGEYIWHFATGTPILDKEEGLMSWVFTLTDIHEKKLREEKKDEFIGIASHELKTPLTTAKAFIQLLSTVLQHSNEDNREALGYVQKANESIKKLGTLIADLLDVTKIQNSKLQFTVSKFSLNSLIEETINSVQSTTDTHKIIFATRADYDIVSADGERIQQVIINLLTNAIKYSPDHNTVVVTTISQNSEIVLSVLDEGIGIPKSEHKRIFNRFHRVQTTTIKFQGLGLGLYICSEIIKRHNGKIWVENNAGKGSVFYVSLPYFRSTT